MSRSARIDIVRGERIIPLALLVGGIEELEFETKKSVFSLRLAAFDHSITFTQVRLAFRLGLEGGGMSVEEALETTKVYCTPGKLEQVRFDVATMLHAAIDGVDDEIDNNADEELSGK